MAKIQYNTKKLRVNTPATTEEIFSFNDANEIKASVNYLYDNPSTPDLSGLIKNLSVWEDEAQDASINITGQLKIANESGFAQLFGGGLSVGNSQSGMIVQPSGVQSNSASGSFFFNRDRLLSSDNITGLGYELTPARLKLTQGLVSRTIEFSENATGSTIAQFPNKNGVIATLDDIPAQQDLSQLVKLQQVNEGVTPQVGNIMVNGAIAISDGAGTEVSLSGQGFTSFSPDGLVLISPSTITIQNLDFMNPVGAGISSRGVNIFNGSKTVWIEPNANGADGQTTYSLPLTSGELALKTDIPAAVDVSSLAPKASPAFTGVPTAPMAAQLSNDDTIVTSKWVWDHDVLNNISKFGNQEQTGWLTLKNWLTFKKINSWANSTNAGNLSYSDTHRWVFMSSSDSIKNVGFEILPSETRTVIQLTLPVTGGTIARLEDLSNYAKLGQQNTFTQNNTFNGYSNFQGAAFQGNVSVNSGKRTTLGGGVDIFADTSIYSGVGKIVITPEYMGTDQTHNITVPANSGTLVLNSDLNAYLRTADISSYVNLDSKTNKTENLTVGATERVFEANINNGFRFGITNDQYLGDTNVGMNNFTVGVSSEKREAGFGNLERGKKLSLTHYSDGFIFNQYSAPKNNQLCVAFPDFNTTGSTGARLYLPASVGDATITVLSNNADAPTSSNSAGVKGEVKITGGYRYECVSNNTWVRTVVETSW